MATKVKVIKDSHTLQLEQGIFDTSTALTSTQRGIIRQATGNFEGRDFEENEDILTNQGTQNSVFDTGVLGGSFNRYTQANIAVDIRDGAGRNGSRYAYVIYRAPDITSSSTWGGVSLFPPDALQRQIDHKFRFSFDYRGYSGGFGVDLYQNYSIGWGDHAIGLPTPWSAGMGAVDTDWEWRTVTREFTATSQYVNWVPGSNLSAWNSSTQYGTGWYGITYNGYVYRHRSGWPAPTLGVNPETEYQSGGIYDWKVPMTAGYLDVYNNIKIGFGYQAQNSRGTHLHIDNITLTDITENQSWRYDLGSNTWQAENLVEKGIQIFAQGTAYVGQGRSDNAGLDIYAVEGSRKVTINGVAQSPAGGRGLNLMVFNSSGTAVFNQTYDVHATSQHITDLANKLGTLTNNDYWVLTSFDAIGTASMHVVTNFALMSKLIQMGSRMWNFNDYIANTTSLYLWNTNQSDVRNTYACVGVGQKIIKEDGSGASETKYKRKGTVDIII